MQISPIMWKVAFLFFSPFFANLFNFWDSIAAATVLRGSYISVYARIYISYTHYFLCMNLLLYLPYVSWFLILFLCFHNLLHFVQNTVFRGLIVIVLSLLYKVFWLWILQEKLRLLLELNMSCLSACTGLALLKWLPSF